MEDVETMDTPGTFFMGAIVRLSELIELILNPVNRQKSTIHAYEGYLNLKFLSWTAVIGKAWLKLYDLFPRLILLRVTSA